MNLVGSSYERLCAPGVALEVHIPDQLWCVVDAGRLKQVLANGLVNALKFTDSGKVDMVLLHDAVCNEYTVTITDTGKGLDTCNAMQDGSKHDEYSIEDESNVGRHSLPGAFINSQYSSIQGISSMGPGAGLGLSLVRNLVSRMGGTVELKERADDVSGAVFKVTSKLRLDCSCFMGNNKLI